MMSAMVEKKSARRDLGKPGGESEHVVSAPSPCEVILNEYCPVPSTAGEARKTPNAYLPRPDPDSGTLLYPVLSIHTLIPSP